MFSIYAKDDHYSGVDNKNYGQDIRYCDEQCKLCEKLQMLKVTNGGFCDEKFEEYEKMGKGEMINDFNLIDHGFCILRVSSKKELSAGILNQVGDLVDGHEKKLKFTSIGQEEEDCGGDRLMMDYWPELNAEFVFSKKVKGKVDKYLSQCQSIVETYLTNFYNQKYVEKGRTLLINEGNVGNQNIHFDEVPVCNCT